MTLVLELPERAEAVLRARAKAEGRPAEEIAAELLIDWLHPAGDLTEADIEAMREGVGRGLADFAAGRTLPFEEAMAQFQEARRRRGTLP